MSSVQFLLTKHAPSIDAVDTLNENMGDRLRRAREQSKITQQDLAEAVGVSRAAVALWENGDTKNIRPENLFRAAAKLRKSARWLSLGEGPEEPTETVYDALAELPAEKAQQSLDFLRFQWENTAGSIASEKIASYTAMIQRIKQDMERKKTPPEGQ